MRKLQGFKSSQIKKQLTVGLSPFFNEKIT